LAKGYGVMVYGDFEDVIMIMVFVVHKRNKSSGFINDIKDINDIKKKA
jgi:hypothetical protein